VSRRKLPIDPEQVKELARIGCNKSEIARMLGCDEGTIRKRFSECFELGDTIGKIQLRRAQHHRATEAQSDTMLIHLGKHRLNQAETKPDLDIDAALNDALNDSPAKTGGDLPEVQG
jgi:hypothetical protein